VATVLDLQDHLGALGVRLGLGRSTFSVEPGLYAAGAPTPESPVLVSANYKLSFDRLRSRLGARDAWILALDTKGVNVWCAAGKGTFGTEEIVLRAKATGLDDVVSHRKLIVPQLGAPGVSAHEVRRQSGFAVVYGPVRAEDLSEFLNAGMQATTEMRRVRFPLRERAVLIPVDIVLWSRYIIFIVAAIFLLSGLGPGVYSTDRLIDDGPRHAALFIVAFLAGAALPPTLLPWLPGRMFATKGAWAGAMAALVVGAYAWMSPGLFENWANSLGWLLIFTTVGSFMSMNFTGASTYTSLSGVRREMSVAVPLQKTGAALGLGLWLIGRFV
jgi:acetyl-CoA decarbonylase/synthase complex subunit gamma